MKLKSNYGALSAVLAVLCLCCSMAFASGTVLDITDTLLTYNHSTDYYTSYSSGTRFRFVAPKAGAYILKFTVDDGKDYFYNYGSDSTFSSYTSYEYWTSSYYYTQYVPVVASAAGESFYFLVRYYSYYSDDRYVIAKPASKVTFVNLYNDLTSADSAYATGDTVDIDAAGLGKSRFSKWKVSSGNCTVINDTKPSAKLVVGGDCQVTASYTSGVIYPITTTPVAYNSVNNYYSDSARYDVRFSFVAPKDGGYGITLEGTLSSHDLYIYRYPNSSFKSYSKYKNFYNSYTDSVLAKAGDTLFYIMRPYSIRDSAADFNVSYSSIKTNTITLTSTSAKCATSVSLDTSLSGQVLSYSGYGLAGYRPNGWKVLTGDKKLRDSTSYTIADTINTDTKYQLQCIAAKVNDITTKKQGYTFINDFYDLNPSTGIRFRFTAPTTGLYAVRGYAKSYSFYYYYYGSDSVTTSYKKYTTVSTSSPYTQYFKATAGDKSFYTFKPYSTSRYTDSVFVVALKAALVQTPNKSYVDTVAIGDTMSVSAVLTNGTRFGGWYVEYGKGKFVDSTTLNAKFIPSSDSVKINFHTDSASIYPVSSTKSTFDYYTHGGKAYRGYGVRTVFVAPDSGSYAFVLNSNQKTYVVQYNDDTFGSSYKYSDYFYSGTSKEYFNMAQPGDSLYFFIYPYSSLTANDSFTAQILKTVKVRGDTSGHGYVYIGSNSRNYDSTYVSGDSIQLRAYSYNDSKFSRWEKVSGSCTISDSTASLTYAKLKGDCKVRAVFTAGVVYNITGTPTEYSVAKHYYLDNYSDEVRFRFVAPKSGTYAITVTRNNTTTSGTTFYLYKYAYATSTSYSDYYYGSSLVLDSVTVSAGDTLYYRVKNYSYSYNNLPFWISYSNGKGSISVLSDPYGSVYPSGGYSSAWLNVGYPITASADSGYRFNRWKVLSGNATIADTLAKSTVVSTKDSAKIKATYKKGSIQTLTTKAQNFSFMHHYFSDYQGSSIYFKWTAPDTAWRMISLVFTSTMSGTLYYYGTDSTFSKSTSNAAVTSNFQSGFQPSKKGESYYWVFKSDNSYNFSSDEFSALVATPYVLTVNTPSKGYTNPMGAVALAPGLDTLVMAVPYGGYNFDSWLVTKGSVTIDDTKSSRTRMKPNEAQCVVEASYSLDFTTVPELTINSLDLNNHPGVCATVSVSDANNGHAIPGLDSTDFVLYQDGKSVPVQVTSVEKVGGVSVALVVDESGSMSGTKMTQAKESIRQFINEMGPYDRTSIVGFTGSSTQIRQSMTSDKSALLAAANALAATGGTNIVDGTYRGLETVVGETNPTAVIVFSDGDDGWNDVTVDETVAMANGLNTTIYSISIGDNYRDPLELLSSGTGGTFTHAPTADKLAEIYAGIRSAVQARYVLCYNSPDAVLDGDTHQVVIKTTFLNKLAIDTAYWDESFLPPVVALTDSTKRLIGRQQTEGDPITIQVTVSSKKSISSVYIYTKTSNLKSNAVTSHAMVNISDSLWSYTVPSSDAVAPGVDFYVVATDVDGLTGKSPAVPNPAKEPYTIPIKNNAPKITSLVDACIDTTSGKGVFDFQVTDNDGIYEVTLYYKNNVAVVFETEDFKHSSSDNDLWYAEIPASNFVNSDVEFYVRALDKKGVSSRYNKFKNTTLPACKGEKTVAEVKDSIALVNASSKGESISRETESISATLRTEDFSREKDTVLVDMSCLVSGDMENNLKMVETSSGKFELLEAMKKDERTAKRNDGRLSCTAADTIVITYKDPLFGTVVADTAAFSTLEGIVYRFMDKKCEDDLDSVTTSSEAQFCLTIDMESPSLSQIDTLKVALFTNTGDTLVVKAIETGKYTSEFKVKGSYFAFVSEKKALKDTVLDAVLNFDGSSNRIKILAQAPNDKSKLNTRDSLIVNSDYVGAELAEIYDRDLDGRADSIRIHYKKALSSKIESIDTLYWNKAGGKWHSVEKSGIVLEDDNKWIYAVLEKQFEYGKTAVDTSAKPYLQLTKSKGDIMQKMFIEDHIGAVPVEAVKHPGEMTITDYLDASDHLPPDTLVITLSEPVKNVGDSTSWKKLFRYSKSCSDTATHSIHATKYKVDSTGTVWTLVLEDYNILVDNCVRTNPSAKFQDRSKNSMGRGGIEVTGKDGSVYLYEVAGNPPISGMGKNPQWIPEKGDSWETQPDSISAVRIWAIAPYHAFITIYDGLSHIVTTFQKDFGHDGEMDQEIRGNDKNHYKVGFLGWNQRSSEGRKVGTGVYIWRIDFKFKDGHSEYRILQTGVKR